MSVEVPVPDQTNIQEEAENEKKKLPVLLKTKILKDLKGRSESLLNVYEDLGITVENPPSATDTKHGYFSNNSRYPTASQILQLDVIADNELSDESITKAQNSVATVANDDLLPKFLMLSNRELGTKQNSSLTKHKDIRERNMSVSPELQKRRNSHIPEMRILLNRKYSLQPTCTSQSFTASCSTVASHRSMFHRRHTDFSNRPLYRDDIFFSSNLKRLPQYTSQVGTTCHFYISWHI